ncbi:MAG: GtrA domain-containing protein [Oscillospiraceae bacterium]|jgi:putative flippase GtrA
MIKEIGNIFDKRFIKFIFVGVINTLVGTAIMFALYNLAGCNYWFSTAANYIVGSILSYFLNKYFTFQNKNRSWKIVAKFILNIAVCYLVAYGLAKPAVLWILSGQSQKVQDNVAMLVGMGFFTLLNYAGQRFFAFKVPNDKN